MAVNFLVIYRISIAIPVIALGGFGLWLSLESVRETVRVSHIQDGDIDVLTHASTLAKQTRVDYPIEWISTATQLSASRSDQDALAIKLLEAALKEDPAHPRAWTLLSFLRTREAGEFTPAAETALQKSNELCGFCERDLLRWRLTYTLQHWADADETTRMAAFRGADFLRWWYLEYDFLNQVRANAIERGIPFDQYRRDVNSPVRPNEVN